MVSRDAIIIDKCKSWISMNRYIIADKKLDFNRLNKKWKNDTD
ncbi:MAG: hypothetical protein RR486_13805 [Clostridium sp.]